MCCAPAVLCCVVLYCAQMPCRELLPGSESKEIVVARRRPSRTRRASISIAPSPPIRPPSPEENKESHGNSDKNQPDLEAGHRQSSIFQSRRSLTNKTPIVRKQRASLIDVARGAVTLKSFVKQRTRRSQRMGFVERNEQNNIIKMERVCVCVFLIASYQHLPCSFFRENIFLNMSSNSRKQTITKCIACIVYDMSM